MAAITLLVGHSPSAHAQKVAVIAGDSRRVDDEWQRLKTSAGGRRPAPRSPRSELRIYDLARPDTPPILLQIGVYACAAFHRDGAELVVASMGSDWKSTFIQQFATDTGQELRHFTIPGFVVHGLAGNETLYEPRPLIRLAKVFDGSRFAILGYDPRVTEQVGSPRAPHGYPPCTVMIFNPDGLLDKIDLPSTSSMFATFFSPVVSARETLIASFVRGATGANQQISSCQPANPQRPGTLLAELPFRDHVFTASKDRVVGWASKLNLVLLPDLAAFYQSEGNPSLELTATDVVADTYRPIALLPRGNGDLLALNALSNIGGVCTGAAQMLIIRPREGDARLGPRISRRPVHASISSDGATLVVLSLDSPQLVALSLPDLKLIISIDTLPPTPTEIAIE